MGEIEDMCAMLYVNLRFDRVRALQCFLQGDY